MALWGCLEKQPVKSGEEVQGGGSLAHCPASKSQSWDAEDANRYEEGPWSQLLLFVLYSSDTGWIQKERKVSWEGNPLSAMPLDYTFASYTPDRKKEMMLQRVVSRNIWVPQTGSTGEYSNFTYLQCNASVLQLSLIPPIPIFSVLWTWALNKPTQLSWELLTSSMLMDPLHSHVSPECSSLRTAMSTSPPWCIPGGSEGLLLGNRHYTLLDDMAHPIRSQAWRWPLHLVPGSRAAGVWTSSLPLSMTGPGTKR